MFTNILVAVDGSAPSKAAVKLALRLALERQAKITFAHAIAVSRIVAMTTPTSIDPGYAIEAARAGGNEVLNQARAEASGSSVTVSTELIEGECVTALLDLATQRKADLIVVGSHGRGGISRALLGSIAEGILRRSKIPVLVTHAALPASATEALRAAAVHKGSH